MATWSFKKDKQNIECSWWKVHKEESDEANRLFINDCISLINNQDVSFLPKDFVGIMAESLKPILDPNYKVEVTENMQKELDFFDKLCKHRIRMMEYDKRLNNYDYI